jgi:hypothetical protein
MVLILTKELDVYKKLCMDLYVLDDKRIQVKWKKSTTKKVWLSFPLHVKMRL